MVNLNWNATLDAHARGELVTVFVGWSVEWKVLYKYVSPRTSSRNLHMNLEKTGVSIAFCFCLLLGNARTRNKNKKKKIFRQR